MIACKYAIRIGIGMGISVSIGMGISIGIGIGISTGSPFSSILGNGSPRNKWNWSTKSYAASNFLTSSVCNLTCVWPTVLKCGTRTPL